MTTLIQETYTQAVSKTCASCPYFQDFGEPNGRGWCGAFDQMARQHHKQTADCNTEIEALEKESQQQLAAHAPEPQPVSFAEDSVSKELQLTQSAETDFEQGRHHGEQDAQAGLHPAYPAPRDGYSTGYLEGYNAVFHPTTQQPEVSKQLEWSVTRNGKWHWYDVWVGDKWVGRAETDEEAERMATAYVATDEIRKRQNAAVMRAYA